MEFTQVCEQSGLSPATVTYYVKEGLITPFYTEGTLAEAAEYAEEDVVRLKAAANLRRLALPMRDILAMLQEPGDAAQLAVSHYGLLEKRLAADQARLDGLADVDLSHFKDIGSLLEMLADLDIQLPLPERDVNRDDDYERREHIQQLEEENAALQKKLTRAEHRQRRQFIWLLIFLFFSVVAIGWIIWPYLF